MVTDSSPKNLATIETSISIIMALRELNGGRITELADHLGLPKSTVYRHLTTLHDHGFVTKKGDSYRLGLRFLDIGEYTRYCVEGFRKAKPFVQQIAEETGERCQFVIEENGRGIYVHVAAGEAEEARTDLRVGKQMFLHSTASGKCILAHLPDERIDEIIDRWGLPRQTPHTVTSKDDLLESLSRVRKQGFAFNRGGNVDGLRAVGAPVLKPTGQPLGAISISGPSYRMQNEYFNQDLPELLRASVEEFEAELE